MNQINLSFIDQDILAKFNTSPILVHSIFKHNLNVTLGDTLITISCKASKQKHIILTKNPIDFRTIPITIGEPLTYQNNRLSGKHTSFLIDKEEIDFIPPYLTTFTLDDRHLEKLNCLKKWMRKQQKIYLEHYDVEDIFLKYQFEKIDHFLKNNTLKNAKEILGLGIGLTPIGDDILFGYLLAKQSINQIHFNQFKFLSIARKQTNIISYQLLKDVIDKHYSLYYSALLEQFFTHYNIEQAKKLINFGETSGMAILTGFIHGLQKGSVTQ